MLINRFKGCTNTTAGVLYFVTEKTLDSLSRNVSSVRFKSGSQKEIQVIKLKLNAPITFIFPNSVCTGAGGGGGEGRLEVAGILYGLDSQNSHCSREFDRRVWHNGGTLDDSN